MPRELRPDLSYKKMTHDQSPVADLESENRAAEFQLNEADFISNSSSERDFRRQVNFQIEQIKRRQRETNERVDEVCRSLNQTKEAQRLRNEQLQALQRDIESYLQDGLQRLSSQFSVRLGRLHEKLANEQKVTELIDRHNQIVQSFELKLAQMQRLMNEQDIKLMSYTDTLKEIRRQMPPKL